MSSLIALLEPQSVCIATDTLSRRTDGGAHNFAAKIFPLPHLRTVICGTGLLNAIVDWYSVVETAMVVHDFEGLRRFAPKALRNLWARYSESSGGPVTIYHFGFDELSNCCRGVAFRSSSDFEPEEIMQNALLVKPAIPDMQPIDIDSLPESFIELMTLQQNWSRQNAFNDIGGEVIFCVLTPLSIMISACHRFEDFEELWGEMLANLNRP